MTTYNFDEFIPRRNHHSIKWKFYDEDVIPMWVADMDFKSPQPVIDALLQRAEHGVYGYDLPSKELSALICERTKALYQWEITPDDLIFFPTLVAGINVVVRALCEPGSAMLTHTPVYFPFLTAPKHFGATLQSLELDLVTEGQEIRYAVDTDAFEKAITPETRLYMMCNPHNPGGFAYSRQEMLAMAESCLKHNVVICSDEIHCELMLNGRIHTPIAALSPEIAQNTITLMAPSKTFNVAGLCCGYAIIQNEILRNKVKSASEGIIPLINTFGLTATMAAYQHGAEWLSQLLPYLAANRDYLVDYVKEHLPGVRVTIPEATYLAWLDCRGLGLENPQQFFLEKARVGLTDGAGFGAGGSGFVRLNFGCPRSTLVEGLERMKMALKD